MELLQSTMSISTCTALP